MAKPHPCATAAASVLPAAKQHVTPADTTWSRTFSKANELESGNTHSSRDDGRQNFLKNLPVDSPRNPTGASGWLVRQHLRQARGIVVADFADTGCDAVVYRARWRGSGGWRSTATTCGRPVGRKCCNTEPTDPLSEMVADIPSADNAGHEAKGEPLERRCDRNTLEEGPREALLPSVKSRSEASTSLRGDSTMPHNSIVIQPNQQSQIRPRPRSTNRGFGQLGPQKRSRLGPRATSFSRDRTKNS